MNFYSRYNPAPQVPIINNEPSMTEQSHKDECDINTIVNNYLRYGDWGASGRPVQPMFGDFTEVTDFRECCDMIAYANEQFNQLPSTVRARFQNNPANLIDFINNAANRDEAIQLGFIPAPAAVPLEVFGS